MARRTATRNLKGPPGPLTYTLPHLWSPRSYQFAAWEAMERGATRFVDVEHRRAGKGRKWLALTTLAMAKRPGLYVHVLPTYGQAKKDIWDAKMGPGPLEGTPFLHAFPGFEYAGNPDASLVKSVNETEMQIELYPFPGQPSGSIWQLLNAENPAVHRGMNAVGIVFDEYSEYKDASLWEEVFDPMVTENGGWVAWIFTPKGNNQAKAIYEHARSRVNAGDPKWFCQMTDITETRRDAPGENGLPVVPMAEIEEKRARGVREEIIQQEYLCSFTGFLRGTIYGDLIARARKEGRIGRVVRDVQAPVGMCLDIGRTDGTAICLYQRIGREIRFIDYYANRLKGPDFYASVLMRKPYLYEKMILPHDAKAEGLMIAESAETYFRKVGFRGVTIAPKLGKQAGVDATRLLFSRFVFDEVACNAPQEEGMPSFLESLEQYRRTWNEELGDYSGEPIHDKYSHGADALRTGVMGGIDEPLEFLDDSALQRHARMQADPLTSFREQRYARSSLSAHQ